MHRTIFSTPIVNTLLREQHIGNGIQRGCELRLRSSDFGGALRNGCGCMRWARVDAMDIGHAT